MNKKQIVYISIFSVLLLIAIILFINLNQNEYYFYIASLLLLLSAIMLNLWVRSKNAEAIKSQSQPQSKLLMKNCLPQHNKKKRMKLTNYTRQ